MCSSSRVDRVFGAAAVVAVACLATESSARAQGVGLPDPRYPANPYGPPPVAGYNTTPVHSMVQTPGVAVTSTTSAIVTTPSSPEAERTYVPNPYLLGFGLTLWGTTYATSVAVAASSSNSADRSLYIPVVGPWIDLGNRGSCSACTNESTNRALLIADGTVQGVGTLMTLWSFFSPEHREIFAVGQRSGPRLHVEPAWVGSSYGVRALAQF
jgi:hypothetical protein